MLLVISGGGARGFYALGILRGIEETGIDQEITAIFGVSTGAIVGSFWSAGYKAIEIYEMMINVSLWKAYKPNIIPLKSFLSSSPFQDYFAKHLPDNFAKLKRKLYIGVTNVGQAIFQLIDSGDLILPLTGSMSLPGIFPWIEFTNNFYCDGGVINNFPVFLAKQIYPNEKTIGVALNKIKPMTNFANIFDILGRSWELSIESSTLDNLKYVDYLFYPELDIQILDMRKNLAKLAYEKGYSDFLSWYVKFQKKISTN